MIKTKLKGSRQVWKKALSAKGDDWTIQYSQATAINLIGLLRAISDCLSKTQGALQPQVYAN